ncbi:hypothetical protein J6590_107606 [Homalodisca vitripennis]|nr:hypothetical protein J6590_107606 [Homalodisca vitripennis]
MTGKPERVCQSLQAKVHRRSDLRRSPDRNGDLVSCTCAVVSYTLDLSVCRTILWLLVLVISSRKRNQVIEEFIDMYKLEPCLGRVKSKEYHDREKRDAAYAKLVLKLKELEPDATISHGEKSISS